MVPLCKKKILFSNFFFSIYMKKRFVSAYFGPWRVRVLVGPEFEKLFFPSRQTKSPRLWLRFCNPFAGG